METEYFVPIDVWEKINEKDVACYRLFQRLSDKHYAVQSKDMYRKSNIKGTMYESDLQRILLFLEEDIKTRGLFEATIEEAIVKFNNSFDE